MDLWLAQNEKKIKRLGETNVNSRKEKVARLTYALVFHQ
jgi:hypothetical protein